MRTRRMERRMGGCASVEGSDSSAAVLMCDSEMISESLLDSEVKEAFEGLQSNLNYGSGDRNGRTDLSSAIAR